MNAELVSNRKEGELLIRGERRVAVSLQRFLNYLDTLVGEKVASVIIHNLESRLGRDEVKKIRTANPNATTTDIIEFLKEDEAISGVGVVTVTLTNDSAPIWIEILNPFTRGTSGARMSYLFSYWVGALSELLGKQLEAKQTLTDDQKNSARCLLDSAAK